MIATSYRHLPLSAARENLRRLVLVRALALLVVMAGVYYAHQYLAAPLRYTALTLIISLLLLAAVFTVLRLRLPWPVTDLEYFCQLLLDVIGLGLLLYFAGGSTNPFISYFLVLLTISAATLPWRYTAMIALLTIAAYSGLLFFYHPLMPAETTMVMGHGAHNQSFFNLHIMGMWFTFVASALLVSYFVVKMAQALREQDEALARSRESALHDEQLLAVATLAAGAAHELNTPLSTMSVVLADLLEEQKENAALHADLSILQSQVQACARSLKNMVGKSQVAEAERAPIAALDYFEDVLSRWQLMRPEARCAFGCTSVGASPLLSIDETLSQAIISLLNNAADASPEQIEVTLSWNSRRVILAIRDHGPGIALNLAEHIGKPFVTTKGKGIGLGLFLSHATLARFNGQVALYNHEQGGTLAELTLPLSSTEESRRE